MEATRSREVMSFLLGFLSSHGDNEVILSHAIAALARLLTADRQETDPIVSDLLESERSIENLGVGMKTFLTNGRIQSYGCLILCEVAIYGMW